MIRGIMYAYGQRDALRRLGLTKHAAAFDFVEAMKDFSPEAIRTVRNSMLGGALGGATIGGLTAAYAPAHRTGWRRGVAGALGATAGGMLGATGGAISGVGQGLGHPALTFGPNTPTTAIQGAMMGGLGGLFASKRENRLRNTLGYGALGGVLGGAGGALVDTTLNIDPEFVNRIRESAEKAGQGG